MSVEPDESEVIESVAASIVSQVVALQANSNAASSKILEKSVVASITNNPIMWPNVNGSDLDSDSDDENDNDVVVDLAFGAEDDVEVDDVNRSGIEAHSEGTFSDTARSDAVHSEATLSDVAHSDAVHPEAAHSDAAHPEAAHSDAAHAAHSDAAHAAHSDAAHAVLQPLAVLTDAHLNGVPYRPPFRNSPPLVITIGSRVVVKDQGLLWGGVVGAVRSKRKDGVQYQVTYDKLSKSHSRAWIASSMVEAEPQVRVVGEMHRGVTAEQLRSIAPMFTNLRVFVGESGPCVILFNNGYSCELHLGKAVGQTQPEQIVFYESVTAVKEVIEEPALLPSRRRFRTLSATHSSPTSQDGSVSESAVTQKKLTTHPLKMLDQPAASSTVAVSTPAAHAFADPTLPPSQPPSKPAEFLPMDLAEQLVMQMDKCATGIGFTADSLKPLLEILPALKGLAGVPSLLADVHRSQMEAQFREPPACQAQPTVGLAQLQIQVANLIGSVDKIGARLHVVEQSNQQVGEAVCRQEAERRVQGLSLTTDVLGVVSTLPSVIADSVSQHDPAATDTAATSAVTLSRYASEVLTDAADRFSPAKSARMASLTRKTPKPTAKTTEKRKVQVKSGDVQPTAAKKPRLSWAVAAKAVASAAAAAEDEPDETPPAEHLQHQAAAAAVDDSFARPKTPYHSNKKLALVQRYAEDFSKAIELQRPSWELSKKLRSVCYRLCQACMTDDELSSLVHKCTAKVGGMDVVTQVLPFPIGEVIQFGAMSLGVHDLQMTAEEERNLLKAVIKYLQQLFRTTKRDMSRQPKTPKRDPSSE